MLRGKPGNVAGTRDNPRRLDIQGRMAEIRAMDMLATGTQATTTSTTRLGGA